MNDYNDYNDFHAIAERKDGTTYGIGICSTMEDAVYLCKEDAQKNAGNKPVYFINDTQLDL